MYYGFIIQIDCFWGDLNDGTAETQTLNDVHLWNEIRF